MSQAKDAEKEGGASPDAADDLIMPMWDVEGVYVPFIFHSEDCAQPQHVLGLRDTLKMRENDIMVLAYPKSGTHWTWEVVTMLAAGRAEYHARSKCFSMLEAIPHKDMESQPSPRVLNSHIPLRLLPQQQIREKKVRLVHVYRNVRDIFVSAFYHFRQVPGSENMTLEDLEKSFFPGKVPFGSYFQYMKDMDDYRKSNPDVPFLSMSFEDMKENPRKAIGNLAKFLGVEASPQLIEDVVQATNFTNMQEVDKTKELMPVVSPEKLFRKGEVGDWKNHMTEDQVKRFDAAMMQLESCDYHFRYEL